MSLANSSRSMRRAVALPTWAARVCMGVALLMFCAYSAHGMEKNDNAMGNNLGFVSRTCSSNFCRRGVSALDLWVSFEQVSESCVD